MHRGGDAELVENKGNCFSGNFHRDTIKVAKSIENGEEFEEDGPIYGSREMKIKTVS